MIRLKSKQEIEKLREGGLILGTILEALARLAEPGVNTEVLEKEALRRIKAANGQPSFKGYKIFNLLKRERLRNVKISLPAVVDIKSAA